MAKTPTEGIVSLRRRGLFALGALLLLGAPLSALEITGGPAVSPPGGGGCTISGVAGTNSGATLSCTVSAPGNFTDLYFGLANDSTLNGFAMDGSGPSSFETFRYSSRTPTSIIYTSSSSLENSGTAVDATTRLILTLVSGEGTVFATNGTPADNGNGDIGALFRISSSSFSVRVDMESNTLPTPVFTVSNSGLYDSYRTVAATRTETRLDFGFYYNACNP